MGTRSLTYVVDDKNDAILCMYRQFDGYPSGHGMELSKFLEGITLIKGIGAGQDEMGKFANGAGCLAAQIVAHFKEEVGQFYLRSTKEYPNIREAASKCWAEYVYVIRVNEFQQIFMSCYPIYDSSEVKEVKEISIEEFGNFVKDHGDIT